MTLHEALGRILASIDEMDRAALRHERRSYTPDQIATSAHNTLGRCIRNDLKLWNDTSAGLRDEIWLAIDPERRLGYLAHWAQVHEGPFEGPSMHAEDASHELIVMVVNMLTRDT